MNSLGRHILVEYYGCDPNVMNDVSYIETEMVQAATDAGATVINSTFHHFSPWGVSGVVVIQESHLAIHTWPEYQYASVDIFTCGHEVNPWVAYKILLEKFKAENGSAIELGRGQLDVLEKINFSVEDMRVQAAQRKNPGRYSRNVWITDKDENIALSLRHTGERIFNVKSDYQMVEVFDTYAFGKTLYIDKMAMTSDKDEFVYHEMIVHPAMQTGNIKNVLVIGGGDGGAIREVLRYQNVEKVVMVEIDKVVIDACKKFFPQIASEFDNPKLQLIVGDGIDYIKNTADKSFDLIIVDSSDPVGPSEGLFSYDFYRHVYRCLTSAGIMVAQSESPHFNRDTFIEIYKCYREIFNKSNVHCYLAFIPTYPTGNWSFSFCSKGGIHPLEDFNADKAKLFSDKNKLKYYNDKVHAGAFALPTFVKDLV